MSCGVNQSNGATLHVAPMLLRRIICICPFRCSV